MRTREKAFKPLTIEIDSIPDAADRQSIETKYDELTGWRIKANEAARRAVLADAEANIAAQQARMVFIELLLLAGKHLTPVQTEQAWTVFRKEGKLTFECPFTEADQRNAMRVQRANVDQAAREIGGTESLYTEDEDVEKPVFGFGGGVNSTSH